LLPSIRIIPSNIAAPREQRQADAATATAELKKRGAEALPYLITRFDSPDVLVRAKTEEVIDSLGTNSIPLLIEGIDHAKNDEVARICCYFLARFDEKAGAAIPHVLPLVDRDIDKDDRILYARSPARPRGVLARPWTALTDPREMVRLRAAQALGRIANARATPKLIAALNDEIWDVR